MASFNRFEALSEDEEVEFEVEEPITSDSDLERVEHMGEAAAAKSHTKKVAFKVVKKRTTSSKNKISGKALKPSDTLMQEPQFGASSLLRSGLASTFSATKSALVPLPRTRAPPSGRGGGLSSTNNFHTRLTTEQGALSTETTTIARNQATNVTESAPTSLTMPFATSATLPVPGPLPSSSLQQAALAFVTNESSLSTTVLPLEASTSDVENPLQPLITQVTLPIEKTSATMDVQDKELTTHNASSSPITTNTVLVSFAPPITLDNTSIDVSPVHASGTTNLTESSVLADSSTSQATVTTAKPRSTLRLHTFRAQLTFGLKPSQNVNVANFFTTWVEASIKLLGNFALLPFDNDTGLKVVTMEDIKLGDPEFFNEYYGNHRSLLHGNLTGMVHFQTSTPWSNIKAFKSRYFAWLTANRVFLNYTKFKTETLVPCGFLVGAHPGYLRRNEAEEELHASLGLDPGEIPFQISARSVSVPIKEDDTRRYTFNAVIIETSTKYAARLRECFYALQDPTQATESYPYTGLYQFVPMVKSADWPVSKIYQLAHLHSSIIDDLKPIYVHHIQDINNVIDDDGHSILQGFYGMTLSGQPSTDPKDRLLHSLHNTAKIGVKLALVQSSKYESALGQLSNLQNILANRIAPKYHPFVFVSGAKPTLSGRQVDSVSSGNYSSYADSLLNEYNPQTGDATTSEYVPPVAKRQRPAVLTYAQAATPSIVATVVVPSTAPSISAITQDEVDKLLASFSQKFTESLGSSMTIQALEQQVQQTSGEIKQVQNAFQEKLHLVASSVDSLSAKVDTQHEHMNSTVESLNITISRQNLVIACIQQEFKATMADLYQKLHLAPPTFNNQGASQLAASPATQPDAYPLAQQLGGAGS